MKWCAGGRVTPVTSPHRRPSTPTQSTPTGIDQAVVDIPLQYFREDFFLDWDLLGPIDTPEQQQVVVDELSSQLVCIYTFCFVPFFTRQRSHTYTHTFLSTRIELKRI